MRDEGYFCSIACHVFVLHPIFSSPMYGRLHLLSCILFLVFISQSAAFAADRDRLDSIGVQKIGDRTFIIHQVVGQETLFSISRRYKVPMVAIQEANEALKQGMKDGQTLLVPFGPSSSSAPTAAPTTASSAPASTPVKSNPAPASTTSTPVVIPEVKSTKVEPPVVVAQPATSSKPAATEAPSNSTAKTPAATTLVLKATHKIVRGESLFSIANKYQVTVAELKEWNSLSGSKVLVGQSLKIFALEPVEASKSAVVPLAEAPAQKVEKKEEAKKEEPKAVEKKEEQPKVEERKVEQPRAVKEPTTSTTTSSEWTSHTVKSGESLFLISKQYGTSIEDLIQWNALTSNNLKVGQSLKVGRAAAIPMASEVKSQPIAAPTQPTEKIVGSSEVVPAPREVIEAPKQEVTAPNTSGGFTNTKETGLAELIPGTEANKKYLVLHRTAPVGSVIRVKNEENNLTIFARVVGVLPETGDNSKVLIKLSQAAFEQLKGVNARFPVEILY
jgi:LysM repeat protein